MFRKLAFAIALLMVLELFSTIQTDAHAVNGIKCPGSVALMYHNIVRYPKDVRSGDKITTDIESFEKVVAYLVKNEYYFPTPKEFADDIKSGECRHKYAIITIDDSWNDPQKMGVLDVLKKYNHGQDGDPKVWFGVITRRMVTYKDANGNEIDAWTHITDMTKTGLLFAVSHSQTHTCGLIDPSEPYGSANDPVYEKIKLELNPSRKDILNGSKTEPLFFIYPGGNVDHSIASNMKGSGYVGAFTVTPGGLDGNYPNYLNRINGGDKCNGLQSNVPCVIKRIEELTKK